MCSKPLNCLFRLLVVAASVPGLASGQTSGFGVSQPPQNGPALSNQLLFLNPIALETDRFVDQQIKAETLQAEPVQPGRYGPGQSTTTPLSRLPSKTIWSPLRQNVATSPASSTGLSDRPSAEAPAQSQTSTSMAAAVPLITPSSTSAEALPVNHSHRNLDRDSRRQKLREGQGIHHQHCMQMGLSESECRLLEKSQLLCPGREVSSHSLGSSPADCR